MRSKKKLRNKKATKRFKRIEKRMCHLLFSGQNYRKEAIKFTKFLQLDVLFNY